MSTFAFTRKPTPAVQGAPARNPAAPRIPEARVAGSTNTSTPATSCTAASSELRLAIRDTGLLRRWIERTKTGDVADWIARVGSGKRIAVPGLRRRRACRVLVLSETPEAALPSKAKFARELDSTVLGQLRQLVALLSDSETPTAEVEEKPGAMPDGAVEEDAAATTAESVGVFANAAVAASAEALRALYNLGPFGTEGRLEGEDLKWTAGDIDALEGAFALTSPAVRALVLPGLFARMQPAAEAGEPHTARLRDVDGSFGLDIAAQDFRGFGNSEQIEIVLHEIGHGIHMRRPELLRRFAALVRGALSTEDILRQVGGRAAGSYLVESAAAGQTEYFAHAYAVFQTDPDRLPPRVREWAEANFP